MFSISTQDIWRVDNFLHAERIFAKRKPWRGGDPNVVPIERFGRRAKHKTLVRLNNDTYAARLYDTNLVTYHRDGRVEFRTYDSQSSMKFIDAVSPMGTHSVISGGRGMFISYRVEQGEGWAYKFVQPEANKSVVLRPVDNLPNWTLENPQDMRTFTVKRVDRRRAREVREKISPFVQWASAVVALSGYDVTPVVRDVTTRLDKSTAMAALEQAQPEDYATLLHAFTVRRFRFRGYSGGEEASTEAMYFVPHNLKHAVTLAAYAAYDAFVDVEIPLGDLPPRERY